MPSIVPSVKENINRYLIAEVPRERILNMTDMLPMKDREFATDLKDKNHSPYKTELKLMIEMMIVFA